MSDTLQTTLASCIQQVKIGIEASSSESFETGEGVKPDLAKVHSSLLDIQNELSVAEALLIEIRLQFGLELAEARSQEPVGSNNAETTLPTPTITVNKDPICILNEASMNNKIGPVTYKFPPPSGLHHNLIHTCVATETDEMVSYSSSSSSKNAAKKLSATELIVHFNLI